MIVRSGPVHRAVAVLAVPRIARGDGVRDLQYLRLGVAEVIDLERGVVDAVLGGELALQHAPYLVAVAAGDHQDVTRPDGVRGTDHRWL